MSKDDKEQLTLAYQEAVANFVGRASNQSSLITVTRAELRERGRALCCYVSVFPETYEEQAVGFLKRQRSACKESLQAAFPRRRVPMVDFELDTGEKHRRRVDELLSQ